MPKERAGAWFTTVGVRREGGRSAIGSAAGSIGIFVSAHLTNAPNRSFARQKRILQRRSTRTLKRECRMNE